MSSDLPPPPASDGQPAEAAADLADRPLPPPPAGPLPPPPAGGDATVGPDDGDDLFDLLGEGTGGADGDAGLVPDRRFGNPWVLRAGAVAVAVVLLFAGVVLVRRARGGPDQLSFRFTRTTHPSGVTVDRQWELTGDKGETLAGTITFTSTTSQSRTYRHDEVFPKTAAANASQVTATPIWTEVIQADPVVRYSVNLDPGRQMTYRYTIPVPAAGRDRERLEVWAADWERETNAYRRTARAREADSYVATTDPSDRDSDQAAAGLEVAAGITTTTGPPTSSGGELTDEPVPASGGDTPIVPPAGCDPTCSHTPAAPAGAPRPSTTVAPLPSLPIPTSSSTSSTATTVAPSTTSPTPPEPAPTVAFNGKTCTQVGTAGNDVLVGQAGVDNVLCGLGGDDALEPYNLTDTVDGGPGSNTVSYVKLWDPGHGGVIVDLGQQRVRRRAGGAWITSLHLVQNAEGTDDGDILVASPGARLRGAGGDDDLEGPGLTADGGSGDNWCSADVASRANCTRSSRNYPAP